MGWEKKKEISVKKQRELFIELTPDEKTLVNILQQQEQVHIDELFPKSKLTSSAVAAALPGKIYKMR